MVHELHLNTVVTKKYVIIFTYLIIRVYCIDTQYLYDFFLVNIRILASCFHAINYYVIIR